MVIIHASCIPLLEIRYEPEVLILFDSTLSGKLRDSNEEIISSFYHAHRSSNLVCYLLLYVWWKQSRVYILINAPKIYPMKYDNWDTSNNNSIWAGIHSFLICSSCLV